MATTKGIPRPTPSPAPNATESFLGAVVAEGTGAVGGDEVVAAEEFDDTLDGTDEAWTPMIVAVVGKPAGMLTYDPRVDVCMCSTNLGSRSSRLSYCK